MNKTTGIFIRMTSEAKSQLSLLAKKNGLSLSEYIRIRVLEKNDRFSEYQKEMTSYGVIAYYTLGKMAKKQLSEEELANARHKANSVLAKWQMSEE